MLNQLKALVRLTVQDPRAAAAGLLADKRAVTHAMSLTVLASVLAVLVSWISTIVRPPPEEWVFFGLLRNPLLFAIVQYMGMIISAILIFAGGKVFGGRGGFQQTLLAMAWIQFLMIAVAILTIPLSAIAPNLADIIAVGMNFYFIWLMFNFITELHGFRSVWKVMGSSFAFIFLILFVLRLSGLTVGAT